MNDWDAFTDAVPWFLKREAAIEVSVSRKRHALSPVAAVLFPLLGKLLAKASVTDVAVNGTRYELLAWHSPDRGRMGWLCLPPTESTPRNIHDEHRELL